MEEDGKYRSLTHQISNRSASVESSRDGEGKQIEKGGGVGLPFSLHGLEVPFTRKRLESHFKAPSTEQRHLFVSRMIGLDRTRERRHLSLED